MLSLYSVIYCLTLVACLPFMIFFSKLRKGFLERLGLNSRLQEKVAGFQNQKERIWIHFASSGELEQSIPLAEEIRRRHPAAFIVFTYFSPSGKKGVELEEARRQKSGQPVPWDIADYSPWDFSSSVQTFLRLTQPKKVFFIHRELWPVTLQELQKQGIPSYLVAAFFPKLGMLKRLFYRECLQSLSGIACVDTATANLLGELSPSKPLVLGDPRCERVLNRKKFRTGKAPWADFFTAPVFVLASVWDEDLKALLPHLASLKKVNGLRWIWVPHEPSVPVTKKLREKLKEQGQTPRLWSQWLHSPEDSSSLIVDSVGFLAELYQVASLVFVGGSFKSKVHNVLEPAAYGCPILTGPKIQNSAEATEMERLKILSMAMNGQDCLLRAKQILEDQTLRETLSKKTSQYLEEHQGASRAIVDAFLQ